MASRRAWSPSLQWFFEREASQDQTLAAHWSRRKSVCVYVYIYIYVLCMYYVYACKYLYIQTIDTLHCNPLHYITLHDITLHYTTLDYIT